MPSAAMWCGARFVISSPLNRTWPESGLTKPVITFTDVVFPEPLRPMMPTTSFSPTEKLTPSNALIPPKLFDTSSSHKKSITPTLHYSITPVPLHLYPALHLFIFSLEIAHDSLGLEKNQRH